MHVVVALQEPNKVFTNLDHVQGMVRLSLPGPASISNIVAKLEGESTTQLLAPPRDEMDSKPRPVQELHKILYMVQQLFPTDNTTGSFLLSAGQYEYPFMFKIPFNTMCHNSSNIPLKSVPSLIKGTTAVSSGHIRTSLPPTLGGFPGLASIRYYVKVTVNRKEFYKENPRIMQNISFVPIESPRPKPSSSENFGRRTYQFTDVPEVSSKPKLSKMFSDLKIRGSSPGPSLMNTDDPPRLEVDARLPEPAILTPTQKVPLRILVTRLDGGTSPLYLQSLHIEIVGQTKIRAGQCFRVEPSGWILTSTSNKNELLDFPTPVTSVDDNNHPSTSAASSKAAEAAAEATSTAPSSYPPDKPQSRPQPTTPSKDLQPTLRPRRLTLPSTLWSAPLPPTIPPSFKTCNISRTYDLEIRVGIGIGALTHNGHVGPGQSAKNQIILPLRLKCQVWSGITPPPELVSAVERPLSNSAVGKTGKMGKMGKDKAGVGAGVSKKPLSMMQAANLAGAANSTRPSSVVPGASHTHTQPHQQARIPGAYPGPGPGPSQPHQPHQPTPPPATFTPNTATGNANNNTTTTYAPRPTGEEEPPPSYEDAMAIDLGPVDGSVPRNYRPVEAPRGGDGFFSGEGGGGGGGGKRRGS